MDICTRFWSLRRLYKLCRILDEAAQEDKHGYYFASIDLGRHVVQQGNRVGLAANHHEVMSGLAILVFLGGLEDEVAAEAGGHRRRYHPEKLLRITQEDLTRYRNRSPG